MVALALAAVLGFGAAAAEDGRTRPVTPFTVSMWLGVVPVEVDGEPWAEFRVAASAFSAEQPNDYGNDGGFTEYNFIRITPAQALAMADGLDGWLADPYTAVLFQANSPDNKTGMAFTGLNVYKDRAHVVLARVSYWLSSGRNGGVFLALSETEVGALSQAVRAWAAQPVPAQQFLYLRWLH